MRIIGLLKTEIFLTFRTIFEKTVKKFTFLFDVDDLGWYNYHKYTVV